MINEIDWGSIPVDKLGTIYEDLLQRYAEEKKGGAGQYFTPRPVIKTICQVMKPKIGMVIHDPATGTGGFLISAYEYILEKLKGKLDSDDEDKSCLRERTGQREVGEYSRYVWWTRWTNGDW